MNKWTDWTEWDRIRPMWTKQDQSRLMWTEQDQSGLNEPNRTKADKMDRLGPNRT